MLFLFNTLTGCKTQTFIDSRHRGSGSVSGQAASCAIRMAALRYESTLWLLVKLI